MAHVQALPRRPATARLPGARARHHRLLGQGPAPSRRRSSSADGRRERVRVLRRPAVRQRLAALRPPLTGYVKDAVPRYQTMRGRRVERRFGWDCHGLPARWQAEQDLGLVGPPGHPRTCGVDDFNAYCRSLVAEHRQRVAATTSPVRPAGSTWSNDYKTMDLPYMESVMWALKQLYDKGLMYEGYRVLPYCWECETPLSNFETRQDDAYRERQDPAVTVLFELETGERVLVWTTTPWTLPSNLALAVGPDIDYAVLRGGRRPVRHRRGHRGQVREGAGGGHAGRHGARGRSSSAARYTPLFPYFADTPERVPRPRRRLRVDRGRHRRRAHGARLRRGRPAGVRGQRHPCRRAPSTARAGSPSRSPDYAGLQVFDANADDHPRPEGPRRHRRATTPTSTAIRTAGAPTRR